MGRWNCDAILEGHDGSVWAVLAYDRETVITGCADQLIRVFHTSGKLLRTIRGTNDVVRALCRVPKGHPSGADFASAGNDGIIRFWTIGGRQVGKLQGHESFIYSLAALPTGELASSGEDRTVRIWKGERCVQTITFPAVSVWMVAACAESGDIVVGASDRVVRVFSRDPERIASVESIRDFEEAVEASSIPQQQLPEINKEKLPGPEFLQRKAGTKEGQVQMINMPDGSVTAHQWSMSQQQWINIGTVVNAVGSSGRKVDYLGNKYDYVFDVDIEDGKPPLKLPYNLSQNPYEAATKFIQDNELPITYLDTVANFITTNTQGATIGAPQNQGPLRAGHDPWGTENRYRPGGATGSVPAATPAPPKILPQKTYLSILVARYDSKSLGISSKYEPNIIPGMQKKIEELNQSLIKEGHKDLSLNPIELSVLRNTIAHVSSSSGSTKLIPQGSLDLALKLILTWPYPSRLPGLDLLRLLAISPTTATYIHPRTSESIIDLLVDSVMESTPPVENNIMMAIRAFANLFESEQGRELASREFDKIQHFASDSVADGKTANRNLMVAVTTLYINYSVSFSSSSDSATKKDFEHPVALLDSLRVILSTQADSEVIYRALVAVGTLLMLGGEVKSAAIEVYSLQDVVKKAVGKAKDPRAKNVGREIEALLK